MEQYGLPKGDIIATMDESQSPYEIDVAYIIDNGQKYILATASGCSCWEGDYVIEEYSTLAELEKALDNERQWGTLSRDSETGKTLIQMAKDAIIARFDDARLRQASRPS